MSDLDLKLKLVDEVFGFFERCLHERFKTQNQKDRIDRSEWVEEQKVQLWQWRVEFITETNEWATDTFRCLLETESDEKLIVEASSLLFEEVDARQSRGLDVWRTAMRCEESLQEVQRRKEISVTRPNDFKSPRLYAQQVLREVQRRHE